MLSQLRTEYPGMEEKHPHTLASKSSLEIRQLIGNRTRDHTAQDLIGNEATPATDAEDKAI